MLVFLLEMDLVPWSLTFGVSLFVGLEYGILCGFAVSVIYLLYYSARPRVKINSAEVWPSVIFYNQNFKEVAVKLILILYSHIFTDGPRFKIYISRIRQISCIPLCGIHSLRHNEVGQCLGERSASSCGWLSVHSVCWLYSCKGT